MERAPMERAPGVAGAPPPMVDRAPPGVEGDVAALMPPNKSGEQCGQATEEWRKPTAGELIRNPNMRPDVVIPATPPGLMSDGLDIPPTPPPKEVIDK